MPDNPKDNRLGLEMREAHYPGRAPIESYGNGGFRFAGMSHRGSLICVPSGIYAWPGPAGNSITPDDLARVLAEAGDIELLLFGAGPEPGILPAATRDALREAGIMADVMATGPAVRTFNVLLADDRRVAAALTAVA